MAHWRGVRAKRRIGGLACSVLGLVACTRDNPAYEGGDGNTSSDPGLPAASSPPDEAGEAPELETSQGSGGGTTGDGSGPTSAGGTTGEETGDTEDLPPPLPEPPQVGPFGEPVRLGINSPFGDDDPTLPADMLELYFASFREGGLADEDIWVSRRESLQDSWGTPEPVMALNSMFSDNTPEISPDGLTMLLSSNRDAVPADVYMATRRDRATEWSTPVHVAELSTDMRDVCPFLTADGQHVYSCAGLGLPQDLLRFDRVMNGWMPAGTVTELDTSSIDCAAWLDPSNRLIVFVSDRLGGSGSVDIWMATRRSDDLPFEPPVVLPGVNGLAYDDDPWLSPDGGTLFFSSTRQVESGFDLYVAERLPE